MRSTSRQWKPARGLLARSERRPLRGTAAVSSGYPMARGGGVRSSPPILHSGLVAKEAILRPSGALWSRVLHCTPMNIGFPESIFPTLQRCHVHPRVCNHPNPTCRFPEGSQTIHAKGRSPCRRPGPAAVCCRGGTRRVTLFSNPCPSPSRQIPPSLVFHVVCFSLSSYESRVTISSPS